MKFSRWWLVAGLVAMIAVMYPAVGSSPRFQSCIRDHKNDPEYHVLHEGNAVTVRLTRYRLQATCIARWATGS
jgi:multisubunit Na+/H+ antiporter MnhB subunit